MQMSFQDRAPLEKVKRLADGRIAAVAKFARSGTYTYTGAEVGRPDLQSVTVYRPEDEVFAHDAMASFAHKAITLGHPNDAVTPANWSKVSVGFTEGRVARDGAFVEIPLMLADAAAVQAYDTGSARELSAGYECDLTWGDGVAPDGVSYQATQRLIRGNHIALVPQGRAGTTCKIGDGAPTGASHMITDAQVATFRDSPQGKEHLAYLRSLPGSHHPSSGAAMTADAEIEALRRHLAPRQPVVVDHAAHQRMEDAYQAQDLNAWRRA